MAPLKLASAAAVSACSGQTEPALAINDLGASLASGTDSRPLVAHVVYRFDTGGLENGIVNLLNELPVDSFRHLIVALTEVTDFRQRVQRDDVEYVSLRKPPGHGVRLYSRLYRLFRRCSPAIVHTRNLAALEAQVPAWAAGVPVRIHGEHGRDVEDLDGSSRRHRWLRRAYRPFVGRYIAMSKDLQRYLVDAVGVPAGRVSQIYNGVDVRRFEPAVSARPLAGCPFVPGKHWLVGSVGRMQAVKDQLTLVHAFVAMLRQRPLLRERARLVLVGDGPLRAQCREILAAGNASELAWLPGERADVPDVMRSLDLFVLPSLAEGVSNTILEAMACGLPVLATAVGGNVELVTPGRTGELVPAADAAAMAETLLRLVDDPARMRRYGQAARVDVRQRFGLGPMVAAYQAIYREEMARSGWRADIARQDI